MDRQSGALLEIDPRNGRQIYKIYYKGELILEIPAREKSELRRLLLTIANSLK